ncbi:hemerythrin [Sulfolobus tengchongensis]|uniref:Hemerythrin n=1 Tax=Sulfolobus tengchongensis TaxID=207809 RepID=A0AAX4L0Y4_9CREN
MDMIELLKFEHGVFRVRFYFIEKLNDELLWEEVERLHNFIVNVHAKTEDFYIFKDIPDAKPYSNDHMLIEKYGNSIIRDKRKDWLPRYIKIVLDHNLNEEKYIFPKIKEKKELVLDVIREYGFEEYEKVTGIDIRNF